jgi:bifunctional UDP-N-acetylglucosamine pyrophosphorylase / glucosamine-1-phosphate N-acetyltransferase
MKDIVAVILAAGKGKRIGAEEVKLPKVMFGLVGKPMIRYSIDNIRNAGISDVVLVVGYEKEKIINYLDDEVKYAEQKELLGTGHAAMMARGLVEDKFSSMLVCYGDMPLYKPETIKKLVDIFNSKKPTIAMLTVSFDDPEFWAYGRIVRNSSGGIERIIEQKDCSKEEVKIQECNPGFYIFDNNWFWQNIEKIGSDNAQQEYYLTDMISLAVLQNKKVIGVPVTEEWEALGINNPDQLQQAEEILKNK